MLTTGDQDTREDGMGISTLTGAVAAVDLASDHSRSQHAFCLVIGRFQVICLVENNTFPNS